MICQACGGSGTVLKSTNGPMREWFRRCPSTFCRGGVSTDARLQADPRPNQIDWYGAFFARASTYFASEVPVCGSWRSTARCAVWDSRDEFEFAEASP